LVQPEKTGYLVPPADPVALSEMLTAVYYDRDRALSLGKCGQQLVRQEFDLKTNVQKKAALFEKAVRQRHSSLHQT
jgi:glycosyltransferase involved in cell wall biosynthesis